MASSRKLTPYSPRWYDAFKAAIDGTDTILTCGSVAEAQRVRRRLYAFRDALLHDSNFVREELMNLTFPINDKRLRISRKNDHSTINVLNKSS